MRESGTGDGSSFRFRIGTGNRPLFRSRKESSVMTKKMRSMLAALVLSCCVSTAAAAAPAIKSIEYEAPGKVEVEFTSKVKYDHVKVKVTDSKGKKVTSIIADKDGKELEFRLKSFKPGKTYRFSISGIRRRGEQENSTLAGKVWIPKMAGSISVKEVDYDSGDKEVEFEFLQNVEWDCAVVKILDGKKNMTVRIKEKDHDGIEVKVKKLKKGKIYHYRIFGIRRSGEEMTEVISGAFKA